VELVVTGRDSSRLIALVRPAAHHPPRCVAMIRSW
jgi:hypothetical protein